MRRVIPFILSVFVFTQAFGETAIINQDSNGRSSANFVGRKNILAVVPKGTKVDVIEKKQMPSGNYGIHVRITALGSSVPTKLKVGDDVWVYYHSDAEQTERVMTLQDANHQVVGPPDTATTGNATKSFSIQQQTPAPATQAPTDCVQCNSGGTPAANTPLTGTSVTQPITDLQNSAASNVTEVVPSVEEIVAYIQKKEGHTTAAELANDRSIAQNIIKYCSDNQPSVLIPLVLSVMQTESAFKPTAKSSAGAEGLLQLMPSTAADLAGTKNKKSVNRYDIETNIKLGVKFLEQLLSEYNGNTSEVLGAYNAGEGALAKIEAGKKKMTSQTTNYIAQVEKTLSEYDTDMGTTSLSFVASTN